MVKVKTGDVYKRGGNFFIMKKAKDGHLYISHILGTARVTSWHRITKKKLLEHYEKVENYNGNEEKFHW